MRYFAEHLRTLGQVSLQIESDEKEGEAVLRPVPARLGSRVDQLELDRGLTVDLIKLPVAVEPVTLQIKPGYCRVKLHPSSSIEPARKPNRFAPPTCKDGSALIAANRAVQWKPLPSEHWAELMDVWHCHKPHEEASSEHGHESHQGLYELAMNGFHAQPGLAYYSETYYLVDPSDLSASGLAAACSEKIWKWDLGEPVSAVVQRMLRELVDAHAVYTIVINDKVAIWVLNTETECSMSGRSMHGAMKVFWADLTSEPHVLDQRPDPEAVVIPTEACDELYETLTTVNSHLPQRLQAMNGWKLSII